MNLRTPPMPAPSSPPTRPVGRVAAVEPDSAAAALGVRPGDGLLAVNGHPVEDVIDVQFHAAEDRLALEIQRGEQTLTLRGPRAEYQALGREFEHPTFDIDIRRCNNLARSASCCKWAPARRTLYIKDDDYAIVPFGHYVTLTNLTRTTGSGSRPSTSARCTSPSTPRISKPGGPAWATGTSRTCWPRFGSCASTASRFTPSL